MQDLQFQQYLKMTALRKIMYESMSLGYSRMGVSIYIFCPFPSETCLRLGQLPLGIKTFRPMQDISILPLIKCLVLKGSFVFFLI